MHRAILRALAACASLSAFSTPLFAAPLTLDARTYVQPAPTVPAPAVEAPEPPPVRQISQTNLGGGFIEFLFSSAARQQQQYPVQPPYPGQPQYAPQDQGQPGQAMYQPEPDDQGYRDLQQQRSDAARFQINPRYLKQVVPYNGTESAGTLIIDTPHKFLYLVQGDGTALRYGVGVGRPGFTWAGVKHVSLKREWPDWTPPAEMLQRQPDLPRHMAGGPGNPLGARALYLGSSLYRIHGSNEPWTIGTNVSSGCIRMRNEDVIDLYGRVKVGTKVVVI